MISLTALVLWAQAQEPEAHEGQQQQYLVEDFGSYGDNILVFRQETPGTAQQIFIAREDIEWFEEGNNEGCLAFIRVVTNEYSDGESRGHGLQGHISGARRVAVDHCDAKRQEEEDRRKRKEALRSLQEQLQRDAEEREALARRDAEEREALARPFDCLGGICLGDPDPRKDTSIITIAGRPMAFGVKVCGGIVVRMQLTHMWSNRSPGYEWQSYDSGDFDKSKDTFNYIHSILTGRGWEPSDVQISEKRRLSEFGREQDTRYDYTNTQTQGARILMGTYSWNWFYSGEGPGFLYKLRIISSHPDYRNICTEDSGL